MQGVWGLTTSLLKQAGPIGLELMQATDDSEQLSLASTLLVVDKEGDQVYMNSQIVMVETPWARPLQEVIDAARQLDTRLEDNQPLVGNGDFFVGKSLAELAHEQGVGPVKDISVFAGGIPDDEDVDELLDEIYRMREP